MNKAQIAQLEQQSYTLRQIEHFETVFEKAWQHRMVQPTLNESLNVSSFIVAAGIAIPVKEKELAEPIFLVVLLNIGTYGPGTFEERKQKALKDAKVQMEATYCASLLRGTFIINNHIKEVDFGRWQNLQALSANDLQPQFITTKQVNGTAVM